MMGRVSGCSILFNWNGPEPDIHKGTLSWEGELSGGQMAASAAIAEAVRSRSELLVWAVCGAGKTEMLYAGIEEALRIGRRVCIATPRTDVVLELAPRLQKVFPAVPAAVLYGGSGDRDRFSSLVISTTHQLLRFENAFDVIIVDEADAFPYSYDASLKFAVKKASKPQSSSILLTATPDKELQRACKSGRLPYVTVPARYHRRPLPIPRLSWCGNWRRRIERQLLPGAVAAWLSKRAETGRQALVFLPHIRLMNKALPLFQKLHPSVEAVHAEDPQRHDKVKEMRSRSISVLLTTTILERGVTFPDIDVAVIGAEDRIFTEAALVQIAGRAGRSADYPEGDVVFFHYGKTRAMLSARNQIRQMNREAQQKGLLDL